MEQKIIYKLDENNYYIGLHYCQKCPETGQWLYINNYTEIKPLEEKEGYVLLFNKNTNQWEYKKSFLNTTIYNKQNYLEKKICDTIEIPNGFTDIKPIDNVPYIWNEILNNWEINFILYKKQKLQEIIEKFNITLTNGHFFSQTLQIEIDCRRSDTKNDLQNVQNIIKYLQLTQQNQLDFYRGYTNPETQETQIKVNVTLEQLQQVELEMIAFGLQIYNTKWQLEQLVENA